MTCLKRTKVMARFFHPIIPSLSKASVSSSLFFADSKQSQITFRLWRVKVSAANKYLILFFNIGHGSLEHLLGYFLLPYRWKNAWALFGSTLFYAWGAPVFVFVLFTSIALDYFIARKFSSPSGKKWLAPLSKRKGRFPELARTVLGEL